MKGMLIKNILQLYTVIYNIQKENEGIIKFLYFLLGYYSCTPNFSQTQICPWIE